MNLPNAMSCFPFAFPSLCALLLLLLLPPFLTSFFLLKSSESIHHFALVPFSLVFFLKKMPHAYWVRKVSA
jgi:hypothetical protein